MVRRVVSEKNGTVFANSRDVAAFFGKNHADVMRDISVIISSASLSPQICGVWFQETTYEQKTGFGFRENRCYDMSRDGFTLLVMGYTGAKAMQFKLAYINAFNEMERTIKAAMPAIPNGMPKNGQTHDEYRLPKDLNRVSCRPTYAR